MKTLSTRFHKKHEIPRNVYKPFSTASTYVAICANAASLFTGGVGKIMFISDSETCKYLSYEDHISTEEVTVFSANINSNFCRVFLPTLMLTPINS